MCVPACCPSPVHPASLSRSRPAGAHANNDEVAIASIDSPKGKATGGERKQQETPPTLQVFVRGPASIAGSRVISARIARNPNRTTRALLKLEVGMERPHEKSNHSRKDQWNLVSCRLKPTPSSPFASDMQNSQPESSGEMNLACLVRICAVDSTHGKSTLEDRIGPKRTCRGNA